MINSYTNFLGKFNEVQKNEEIVIRHTKDRYTSNDKKHVIHKEIKIYRRGEKLYIKEIERNKTLETTEIINKRKQITEASLEKKHAYLATLFSKLNQTKPPKRSVWESFKVSKSKSKWFVRFFLLDTRLVGGLIGHVIAYSANKENTHYRTVPSHILAKTLGPLIFPAGFKKPVVKRDGLILLDSVIHKQYKSLKNYKSKYTTQCGTGKTKTIRFKNKQVTSVLRGENINIETIKASNSLVKKINKDHIHVIYFNGNSGCYQQDYKLVAEDLISYEKDKLPVTAIQFNYPGILNSEGQIQKAYELVDTGIAQVEALLAEGVAHHNIFLHGVSLGGSVASHVGAHFHKLRKEEGSKERQTLGGCYGSRTFASTAQVGRDFFNRSLGDNIFSRAASTLSLPWIKLGTWGSEWDLDTGKAFFSIPTESRGYSVVITSKADRKAYRKEHLGTKRERFTNFILRRKNGPADDAILRRGLHDSWEKQWKGFWTKRGWYGKEKKARYSQENRSRKMRVYNFNDNRYEASIDGHAKATYCFNQDGKWFDPKKTHKTVGLVHRMPNDQKIAAIEEQEAGMVARKTIKAMAEYALTRAKNGLL